MNLVKTYIEKSNIEGLGLFAKEFIRKGDLIWKLHTVFDIKIPIEQFEGYKDFLSISQIEDFKKYAFIKDNFLIYCCDNAKFANHSNYPNTISTIDSQYAKYDIQIGEEITVDYGEIEDDFECF